MRSTGKQEVAGSIPAGSGNNSFVETDHEIFSTVILSFPGGGQVVRRCRVSYVTGASS